MRLSEISNGYYEVLLVDNYGRQASTSDNNPDVARTTCEQYVLDIERQISKNYDKFLYDLLVLKLDKKAITNKGHDDDFGSWFIEVGNKKIVFDKKLGLKLKQDVDEAGGDQLAVQVALITIIDINKIISSM